jgi:predicted DNA binding CopG/RHH family protein
MNRRPDPVPHFSTEAEERAYWEHNDSADHVNWTTAAKVRLPNLKPSSTSISLHLPNSLLEQIKVAAGKRGVPYQSLIKIWLAEKIETSGAKR